MNREFENRDRFHSIEEAKAVKSRLYGAIHHILVNDDRTYSVMRHSVCEHCDYCSETNVGIQVHKAKPDAYEFQKITVPENYGLTTSQEIDDLEAAFNAVLFQMEGLSNVEQRAFLLKMNSTIRSMYRNYESEG